MKILSLFVVGGILFTTQAFANEFCDNQYQLCVESFVSESKCATGRRNCEAARSKDQDVSKKTEANDKAPPKSNAKDQ